MMSGRPKRYCAMPDPDEFEIQLIDGFNDAILGCIYEDDGTPLPCYSSEQVMSALQDRGMTEDEAMSELLKLTKGVRLLWIHPLEMAD